MTKLRSSKLYNYVSPHIAHTLFDVNFINLCCVHDVAVRLKLWEHAGKWKIYTIYVTHYAQFGVSSKKQSAMNCRNLLTQNDSSFQPNRYEPKFRVSHSSLIIISSPNYQRDHHYDRIIGET